MSLTQDVTLRVCCLPEGDRGSFLFEISKIERESEKSAGLLSANHNEKQSMF